MGQLRIFMSHSSQDNAFTSALAQALRGAGADVWYDQDDLGVGALRQLIMRELSSRPVFIVTLSKAAFTSRWVQDECEWAYNLYRREPNRLLLPVTAAAYEPVDFNAILFVESLRRVELPGLQPYPQVEAIERTLNLLDLTAQGALSLDAAAHRDDLAAELIRRGQLVSAQGVDDVALAYYQCAAHIEPTSADAWYLLGYALNELDRWESALHALQHAQEIDPSHAAVWGNIGYALNRLERFEEGLAASERAVALDPSFATGWNNLGWAQLHLERYPEALVAFDQALSLSPQNRVFLDNRATTLSALGLDAEVNETSDRSAAPEGGDSVSAPLVSQSSVSYYSPSSEVCPRCHAEDYFPICDAQGRDARQCVSCGMTYQPDRQDNL